MLPSTLFYNDTLEPCAPPQILNTEFVNWKRLPRKGCPIIFKSVEYQEDWVDEGSSWFNMGECQTVVDVVIDLISQSESYVLLKTGDDLGPPRVKYYASVASGPPSQINQGTASKLDLKFPSSRTEGGPSTRHKLYKIKPNEISVITPFREQVWLIRVALRKVGLGDVDVGNVEALQGAEKYIV